MLTQTRFKRSTRNILGLQILVALTGAGIGFVLGGATNAFSAFVGGGISFIATAFFALRVFSGRRGQPAKQIVRGFYAGEMQKILLTIALFLVAIVWLEVEFLPMFLTYMVGLFAFWLALLPVLSGVHE